MTMPMVGQLQKLLLLLGQKFLSEHGCLYSNMCSGPLGSRAEKAIGFIKKMITYSYSNAPLQKELLAGGVQHFLGLSVKPKSRVSCTNPNYILEMKSATQQRSWSPFWPQR
ncbi:hypothetical protein GW17_00025297 [Ensete ventricosum]|nr:hypothetical protein GW17_00025297 [Ensete ventricosum]